LTHARTPTDDGRVLAVAHRAGNDLTALRDALARDADVVEADVHSHRGRLEVRHHKALGPLPWRWDRRAGTGRVPLLRDSWELQPASAFPLRLPELLDAARSGTTLMLDLKGVGGVGPAVVRLLHERVPEAPVIVCGRWWPSVDAFAGAPWALPVLSARGSTELARLRRRLRRGPVPYGVSVHRSLLAPEVVRELRARVRLVMTWPVNDGDALAQVLERGVNGVITDSGDVLDAVVGLRAAP
jgi:glycerophosphoryl diester phosphodiesterase